MWIVAAPLAPIPDSSSICLSTPLVVSVFNVPYSVVVGHDFNGFCLFPLEAAGLRFRHESHHVTSLKSLDKECFGMTYLANITSWHSVSASL